MSDEKRNVVLALFAQNENDVLELTSKGYHRSFCAYGYELRLVNLYHQTEVEAVLTLLKEGVVAFVYAFAGVGSRLTIAGGENLWTFFKVPFLSLWYDHPSYNYRQHMVDSPYVLNVYHIRDHLDVRQKHLPKTSGPSTLVDPLCEIIPSVRSMPFKDKKGQILFVKTAARPEDFAEHWKRYPKFFQDILWALAEAGQKNRNFDIADEAGILFDAAKLDRNNLDLFMGCVQEVDAYIRGWRSDKLAKALLPHPADIVGRGWEYLSERKHQAAFHGPIPANVFWKHLRSYKIVANSSPLWRDGMHERVVSSINAGAIALTDRSEKTDWAFGGLPTYLAFDWEDDLQDVIAEALKKANEMEETPFDLINEKMKQGLVTDRNLYVSRLMNLVDQIRAPLSLSGNPHAELA